MTQPKATIIDQILKIYKNSANRVIGIHCISVHEDREAFPNPIQGKINNSRFKRTSYITTDFHRLNLEIGESRTVSKVSVIGKYDDFTYNVSNNDIFSVTYLGNNETNAIEIPLKDFPTVGDEL